MILREGHWRGCDMREGHGRGCDRGRGSGQCVVNGE